MIRISKANHQALVPCLWGKISLIVPYGDYVNTAFLHRQYLLTLCNITVIKLFWYYSFQLCFFRICICILFAIYIVYRQKVTATHWFINRLRCFALIKSGINMVGVSGFEPEASWSRTKRDTKLRHTPILFQASRKLHYKTLYHEFQVVFIIKHIYFLSLNTISPHRDNCHFL